MNVSTRIQNVLFSLVLGCVALPLFNASIALAKPTTAKRNLETTLENVIPRALIAFNTPGLSIAIVNSEKVLYQKGFGFRDLNSLSPVTASTYFRLASTSKAFTATSVAMQVAQGKLNWDDRVIDHLPEFRMYDPYVTREMTVRDLLTHRSGLGAFAGDAMLWPEPASFSRTEIVNNLRFLTPQYSFRAQYAYSNVMYITAAEVVAKLVEQDWSEYVDTHIFAPLNMQCFAGDVPESALQQSAQPYGFHSEIGIYPIPRNAIKRQALASAAAGGLVCNAAEMSKWLQFMLQLNKSGAAPVDVSIGIDKNHPLISFEQLNTLWTPQTLLPVDDFDKEWDETVLKAYGMGWRISNLKNHRVISHTGTLSGFQAYVALLPEQDIGVVILNNGSNSALRSAVMQTVLRYFLPNVEQHNWVEVFQAERTRREREYKTSHGEPSGSGQVFLDPVAYTGHFQDVWFGKMHVVAHDNIMRINSERMPTLTGTLRPFDNHTWVIEWDNQNAADDAFIHYAIDEHNLVSGFRLTPFDTEPQTNHEWRDMYFEKITLE
ncbi:serine hydrolase [Alteromonas facilis]|uniref:serine hydrolase n=1 Tax=Alteromonas facilis TaxID=2048004 RepID=UPI0013DC09F3|nr:serine hydrolase [Alteromonas facilis]